VALRPDPGTEADFKVENNPFAFSPGQLGKLLNPKSLQAFRALGGLRGIESGLQSDVVSGLSVDEISARTRITFEQAVQDNPKVIEKELGHPANGSESFSDRIRVYGRNVLPAKKPTPYYKVFHPL
jgi:P-type Ca2+ transporter type 2C